MARKDEISSTEKLLNLIRGNGESYPKSLDTAPSQPRTYDLIPSFSNIFSFGKTITVGVEIGYDALKLVKIAIFSDKKQELLDYLRVPFDSDVSQDSPQFAQLIESTLTGFCGSFGKIGIWCTTSSAQVEIRYLRIPKVSKKQIANVVYWTYQKQVPFDNKEEIFDFELLGETIENGVPKIEVVAYTVPRDEIETLEKVFSRSGYPLTGVSIVPFAVQNLLRTRWIETDNKNICNLFVGRDWSRIVILSDGNLVLSRGVKTGMNSMVEAIREEMHESRDEPTSEMVGMADSASVGPLDEKLRTETGEARKIFSRLIHDESFATDSTKKVALDAKEEEVFKMVLPALDRLIRQIERTFEHYSINFGNESVDNIYISGQIIAYDRIIDYMGEQLGIPVNSMDPFQTQSDIPDELLIPESKTERESFVPAIGIALSNNSVTPNFIFTYKEKEKPKIIRRINRIAIAVFLFLMVACIGISFYQGLLINIKKTRVAQLQQQLDKFSPQVDQDMILQLTLRESKKQKALKKYVQKYLSMAVISEIANITPSNIRLFGITAEMGGVSGDKFEDQKKILILDGIVLGNRLIFEPALAGYLLKLKNSSIFSQPKIIKKSFETLEDKEVLRFNAQLELI